MDWLRGLSGRLDRHERRRRELQALGVPTGPAPLTEPAPLTDLGQLSVDEQGQAVFEGLDFAGAIRAHQLWKRRLLQVMDGASDENFDIARVRRDDCCDLGRWLHGDAKRKHGGDDVFRRLLLSHQTFHETAADVLVLCQAGDVARARELVERGLYARFSVRVQGLLAQFFIERQNGGPGGPGGPG
ncbi:CZB domain-containing protein [Sphaerotilus mobilis]|nr:CZB domain-containing protein [Sphaerotilus mobilis]